MCSGFVSHEALLPRLRTPSALCCLSRSHSLLSLPPTSHQHHPISLSVIISHLPVAVLSRPQVLSDFLSSCSPESEPLPFPSSLSFSCFLGEQKTLERTHCVVVMTLLAFTFFFQILIKEHRKELRQNRKEYRFSTFTASQRNHFFFQKTIIKGNCSQSCEPIRTALGPTLGLNPPVQKGCFKR